MKRYADEAGIAIEDVSVETRAALRGIDLYGRRSRQAALAAKKLADGSKGAAGQVSLMSRAMTIASQAFPILSAAVLVDRFRDLAFTAGRVSLEIAQISERSGITVTTIERLTDASRKFGVELDDVDGLLESWVERVQEAAEGSGEGAAVFKELGISVRDAGGNIKNTESLLFEYGNALSRLSKQTERAAYNTRLLGRDGFKLGPALREIAKEGQTVNERLENQASNAKTLNAEWTELTGNVTNATRGILNDLTPAFRILIGVGQEVLNTFSLVGDLFKSIGGFGDSIEQLGSRLVKTYQDALGIQVEAADATQILNTELKEQNKNTEEQNENLNIQNEELVDPVSYTH